MNTQQSKIAEQALFAKAEFSRVYTALTPGSMELTIELQDIDTIWYKALELGPGDFTTAIIRAELLTYITDRKTFIEGTTWGYRKDYLV